MIRIKKEQFAMQLEERYKNTIIFQFLFYPWKYLVENIDSYDHLSFPCYLPGQGADVDFAVCLLRGLTITKYV